MTSLRMTGIGDTEGLKQASPAKEVAGEATGNLDTDAVYGAEESFGASLRRMRRASGLTASEFATAVGVSVPAVCNWELGHARPRPKRLARIADVLGVNSCDLVGSSRTGTLTETVSRVRLEIAQLAGVAPERVKIYIEL